MSRHTATAQRPPRIAAILAAANGGDQPLSRLATTKPPVTPAPAAVVAPAPAKPAPHVAKVERSPEVQAVYDATAKAVRGRLAATLATVRASALYGEREKFANSLIAGGMEAEQVIGALGVLRTTNPTASERAADKSAAIDALWARAHAAAAEPDKRPAASATASSDVWDRAYAREAAE